MALKHATQWKMSELVRRCRDELTALGPIKTIDMLLETEHGPHWCGDPDGVHPDIRANRQEAEQYLAGLLGMM